MSSATEITPGRAFTVWQRRCLNAGARPSGFVALAYVVVAIPFAILSILVACLSAICVAECLAQMSILYLR